jgi:hypothetical protein
MVRASLKSLSDFRRNKTSAIKFLRRISNFLRTLRSKSSNAVEILTPDGEISREKVRQILSMMQDIEKKEAVAVSPASLIDFSAKNGRNSNSRRGAIVGDQC